MVGNNCASLNKKYAEKMNFTFDRFETLKTKDEAPHYGRYRSLIKLFDKYPKGDYFIYIDGDAAVVNHNIDLRRWIPKDPDIYVLFANEIVRFFKSTYRNLKYGLILIVVFLLLKTILGQKNL